MVRIEPCATTVRSGHVVVRKKRRSSMARLKEAACSTSFCFFFHFFFLLLLLFCETLSSTGLKTQREREKRNLLSDHVSLSFSLVFETTSSKKFSLREKEREKKLKLFVIFLFVSRYRLVNELIIVMVIIMINRVLI